MESPHFSGASAAAQAAAWRARAFPKPFPIMRKGPARLPQHFVEAREKLPPQNVGAAQVTVCFLQNTCFLESNQPINIERKQEDMKTADKTTYKNMSLCSFGNGANLTAVDSMDSKIVRMRPVHFDQYYTKEDLNYWTINAKGHTFEPGMKTLNSPFTFIYKTRTYSLNRIPFLLKRVACAPHDERTPQNRG